jgi:hypothetical protein
MQVLHLSTNEGDRYILYTNSKRMQEEMYKYIRAKRAKGVPLSAIQFTWTTVQVISLKQALAEFGRLSHG